MWLSVWALQLCRKFAEVASRWRHCANLTGTEIKPLTSLTVSGFFAPTGRVLAAYATKNFV